MKIWSQLRVGCLTWLDNPTITAHFLQLINLTEQE